jgi:hypothetical protein
MPLGTLKMSSKEEVDLKEYSLQLTTNTTNSSLVKKDL